MIKPNFPLYAELLDRAIKYPVERPNWELYWNYALTLKPAQLEPLLALVQYYRASHPELPNDIVRPLPGGKGVTVNTDKMPAILQQVVLQYLNQVME